MFSPAVFPTGGEVAVSDYVEARSAISAEAAALAVELGNRVISGRQTCDGDIFEWSRQGVCIQIIDPNRPAFPVVETARHVWAEPPAAAPDHEPSDAQLVRWADEGRVLTSLVFHSGEVAHNEAMLALVDFAVSQDLKLGLGVHAARYETCPQMWELIGVPVERGGALGLVEPLLHSGGLGVMAECNCPPEILREHCERALARIRDIAGPRGAPRGYYAFMDSNLDRLDSVRGDLFAAITRAGLDYVVSSALPGRNRHPAQAAQDWQLLTLDLFQQRVSGGEAAADQVAVIREHLPDGIALRMMRGIATEPGCLACHGQDVAAPVREAILARYPDDRATGFAVGDLRGALWVEVPVSYAN